FSSLGEFFIKEEECDLIIGSEFFYLSEEILVPKIFNCLTKCLKKTECAYVTHKQGLCSLYNKYASAKKVPAVNVTVYKRISRINLNKIAQYWPVFNSSTNEIFSGANMYGPVNVLFIPDRNGIPNSAIRLTRGYYSLPARNYFSGDFTIMSWVKLTETLRFQRFIDCGSDRYKTVTLSLSYETTNKPYFKINYDSYSTEFYSDNALNLSVWYHLTFSLKDTIGYYYRNGVLDKSGGLIYSRNITRTSCYLGKSHFDNDPKASADFDDIKFFDRALSIDEINREMEISIL
ncbi:unnamed protein product, partial [Brachionus calyciflorus]